MREAPGDHFKKNASSQVHARFVLSLLQSHWAMGARWECSGMGLLVKGRGARTSGPWSWAVPPPLRLHPPRRLPLVSESVRGRLHLPQPEPALVVLAEKESRVGYSERGCAAMREEAGK